MEHLELGYHSSLKVPRQSFQSPAVLEKLADILVLATSNHVEIVTDLVINVKRYYRGVFGVAIRYGLPGGCADRFGQRQEVASNRLCVLRRYLHSGHTVHLLRSADDNGIPGRMSFFCRVTQVRNRTAKPADGVLAVTGFAVTRVE